MINDIKKFLLVFQLLCISGLAYTTENYQQQVETVRSNLSCLTRDPVNLVIGYLEQHNRSQKLLIPTDFNDFFTQRYPLANPGTFNLTLTGLWFENRKIHAAYCSSLTGTHDCSSWDHATTLTVTDHGIRCEGRRMPALVKSLVAERSDSSVNESDIYDVFKRGLKNVERVNNLNTVRFRHFLPVGNKSCIVDYHTLTTNDPWYVNKWRGTDHPFPVPEVYTITSGPILDIDQDSPKDVAQSVLATLAVTAYSSLKEQHSSKLPMPRPKPSSQLPQNVAPLSNQQKSDKHVRNALLATIAAAPALILLKATSK